MPCTWYPEKVEVPNICSVSTTDYDRYVTGVRGGPALQYRWRMNTDFTAVGIGDPNVGTGGTMPLRARGTVTGLTSLSAGIVLNVADTHSVVKGLANNSHTAAVLVDGSQDFTIGGWFLITGAEASTGLFKTNAGNSGYRCGLHVRVYSNRLGVTASRGSSGTNKEWLSPIGSFGYGVPHFVVLVVTPSANTASLQLNLYIDGVNVDLTSSGSDHAIDWNVGIGSEEKGISFSSDDGQSNGSAVGAYDDLFFHFDRIRPVPIAEMYRLGTGGAFDVGSGDMNCAHIVYDCVTNKSWGGMRMPPSSIDEASFIAAADQCYTEGMGESIMWVREGPVTDFIQDVMDHCMGVFGQDPRSAKFYLKLIRGDYDVEDLLVLDESNVDSLPEFERVGYGELVNQIVVTYTDRANNYAETPITVQNLACIQAQGYIVSESHQRLGFSNSCIATRAAMALLRARSTPLAKGTLRAARRLVAGLLPGDVFVLTWPKRKIAAVPMRVLEVDWGRAGDGLVSITFSEDVYGLPDAVYLVEQPQVEEEVSDPANLVLQQVFEAPYWMVREYFGTDFAALPAAVAFVASLAARNNGYYLDYAAMSRQGADAFTQDYYGAELSRVALLAAPAVKENTSVLSLESSTIRADTTLPTLALLGQGELAEWVLIESSDMASTATVARGYYDTTPQDHPAGTVLWVLPGLPFISGKIWEDGDSLDVRLLPTTTTGQLAVEIATNQVLTMVDRIARPYPPGNVLINGEAWPTLVVGPTMTVTAAHRDRTALAPSTQGAASVGPEAGTTYNFFLYNDDTDALIDSEAASASLTWVPTVSSVAAPMRLEIEALRAGLTSWQRQVRNFLWAGTTLVQDTEGEFITDTEGNYIQEA